MISYPTRMRPGFRGVHFTSSTTLAVLGLVLFVLDAGCIAENPNFAGAKSQPGDSGSDNAGSTQNNGEDSASAGDPGGNPGEGGAESGDSSDKSDGTTHTEIPEQNWGVISAQSVAHAWHEVNWSSVYTPKLCVLVVGWGAPSSFTPTPGQIPQVGADVLYVGNDEKFSHENARPGEQAFYSLYAMREDGSFTEALQTELAVARWPSCPSAEHSCYDHPGAVAIGRAITPDQKRLELVDADGPGPGTFRIWKEFRGDRVLRADGSDQWSTLLALDGRVKAGEHFRPLHIQTPEFAIVGRVCPIVSYESDDEEIGEDTCLYFSATSVLSSLDQAGQSQTQDGQIGLGNWVEHTEGLWDPRWYVGNVQYCARKGMRLPTLYEFAVDVAKSDKFPRPQRGLQFSATRGLPIEFERGYWTASAAALLSDSYWSASPIGGVIMDRRVKLHFVCVIH